MATIAEQEAALLAQLATLRKNRRSNEAIEALDAGALPQGVRLVRPGAESGVTLVLTADEAALLIPAVRQIAEARIAE